MRLNPSEYLEYAPQEPGGQVHINHEGCSAGVDRKKRLYIKRLPDNSVLAYCHHCSMSGIYRPKVTNIHLKVKSNPVVVKDPKDIRLPLDIVKDTTLWPSTATGWLIKYGITKDEVNNNGIVYSPSHNRLLFPLYMDGDYIGWQGRALVQDKTVPKYITTVDSNRLDGNCGVCSRASNNPSGVLVEDCLSAIKVSRHGVDGIALLGSHPTPEVINWIASKYNNITIWLDNDKPEVKKQQQKLNSLFKTLVSGEVKLILTDKDPKDYSDEEITELLK